MRNAIFLLLPISLFLIIGAGCKKTDWDTTKKSDLWFEASDTEVIIAGKPLILDTIELALTDMVLNGERIQANSISLVQPMHATTNFLTSSSGQHFNIPIGTYTEMTLSTNLELDGTPSIRLAGTYYFQNNNTYEVSIALDLDATYNLALTDTDGSTNVLIDENINKSFRVELDTEVLFSEINPGLWNAANVTSQNGSQTIVVDEMNNANIYNALNAKIGESLTARFQ